MISVVVPCHCDGEGAYLTLCSARSQADFHGIPAEFILVNDHGTDPTVNSAEPQLLGVTVFNGRWGSPQASRDRGIRAANHPWVLCLDSHVILSVGALPALLDVAQAQPKAGLVFPAMTLFSAEPKHLGYSIAWDSHLWHNGYLTHTPEQIERGMKAKGPYQPFRLGIASHGAFLVNREAYLQTGGYTLEQRGWGGEETYLGLMMWLMGWESWMVPGEYHWHYTGNRRAHGLVSKSAEYVRNFLVAAYLLGGMRQLTVAQLWFSSRCVDPIGLMLKEVVNTCAAERNRIEAGPFGGDLLRLTEFFAQEGILC